MDKIDKRILIELTNNSRQTISQLAKKTHISRDVAQYRIQQLSKKGIIRDYVTIINHEKLGYISALFFLSIKANKEKEFIDYVNGLDYISWAGTHLGFWSLGMAIYGKNVVEIEERFQELFQKYKDYISNHEFYIYKSTEFYTEKYFGTSNNKSKTKAISDYRIDDTDKKILCLIAKNSRMFSVEIAKQIGITPVAIAKRITKLERSDYIKGYSIYVNPMKIGFYLFVFFIQNRNLEQRKKLFLYLQKYPNISMLLDYVGDPFIEFGLFTKDPYEARVMLQEIKETFPDNELVDFFLSQEDFLSYGAPKCVFE